MRGMNRRVPRETPVHLEPYSIGELTALADQHGVSRSEVKQSYTHLSGLHKPAPVGLGLPFQIINQLLAVQLQAWRASSSQDRVRTGFLARVESQVRLAMETGADYLARQSH